MMPMFQCSMIRIICNPLFKTMPWQVLCHNSYHINTFHIISYLLNSWVIFIVIQTTQLELQLICFLITQPLQKNTSICHFTEISTAGSAPMYTHSQLERKSWRLSVRHTKSFHSSARNATRAPRHYEKDTHRLSARSDAHAQKTHIQ